MIKSGAPFRTAQLMALAIAAAIHQFSGNTAGFQGALAGIGRYQGRGKGKTRSHDRGGSRAYQRAAVKARNRIKFRRANRG